MTYEFRWTGHNVEHIAKHGVETDEAEWVVEHPDSGFPRAEGDGKYLVAAKLTLVGIRRWFTSSHPRAWST